MITFCTCTAQSGGFSEAIGSHCGKRRKSPTEAERKPTVWRERNKFKTTAPPVMILNKAGTNCQCLDSKASVSSKGGMQLSGSSWWKIRGSVPSQNLDRSHCRTERLGSNALILNNPDLPPDVYTQNNGDVKRITFQSNKWFNSDESSYVWLTLTHPHKQSTQQNIQINSFLSRSLVLQVSRVISNSGN